MLIGGSPHKPSDYRRISLLCSLSKIFTKQMKIMLGMKSRRDTARITVVLTKYLLCSALYRNIYVRRRGRCYVIFVAFSKAFDAIPHLLSWFKLINTGIHDRVLKVLRSMYLALKSCVRTPESINFFFNAKQVPDRDVCLALFYLFYILVNLQICLTSLVVTVFT